MFALIFGPLLITAISVGQVRMAAMQFQDCGNGEVESIYIDPCPRLPCHFDQGQRANVSITFVSQQRAASVYVKSTLRRGGLFKYEVDVPEDDPSVCREGNPLKDFGKVQCPLEPNGRYTFVYSRPFPVSTSYNIFHYSKLRFHSGDGKIIACADMRLHFNRAMSDEYDNDEGRREDGKSMRAGED